MFTEAAGRNAFRAVGAQMSGVTAFNGFPIVQAFKVKARPRAACKIFDEAHRWGARTDGGGVSQYLKHAVSNPRFQMRVADYARLFSASWRRLAATAVVCVAATMSYAAVQPASFKATAQAVVMPELTQNEVQAVSGEVLAKSKARFYASLAGSPAVVEAVRSRLNLQGPSKALIDAVHVEVADSETILEVTAEAGTASNAKNLADTYLDVLTDQLKQIEDGSSSRAVGNSVAIVPLSPAMSPTSSEPRHLIWLLVGSTILGVLLGMILSLCRLHTDRKIRHAVDVEQRFEFPVLANIPMNRAFLDVHGGGRRRKRGEGGFGVVRDRTADVFRELRTNIIFASIDSPVRVVTITSAVPGEGKSSVAANLASAIAADGRRVVLVDADLRSQTTAKPRMASLPGLSEVLSGQANVEDVLQPWSSEPNLRALGPGRIPPNPSELLGSQSMADLISGLATDHFVVIDAPSVLPFTDAAVFSSISDGYVVVVSAGRTTYAQLEQAIYRLERVRARVLGSVMNRTPLDNPGEHRNPTRLRRQPTRVE